MPAISSNVELLDAAIRNDIPLVAIAYKDRLPDYVSPGGYIFNLADHDDGAGTHWTGAWVEGKQAVYFDPFGFPAPENVKRFFRTIDRQMEWSDVHVQNIQTAICGYYVLYFLWHMAHRCGSIHDKFKQFKKMWSNDPEDNRKLLAGYLETLN